jgi:hypothetical protein
MNRFLALALIVQAFSSAAAVAAEPISIRTNTAGELADACATNPREPGADARINFCHGFAQGAITVQLKNAGDKKPFCFPNPPPSRTSTMREFVNWVRAVPDRASMPSADGLFRFLGERYPCNK